MLAAGAPAVLVGHSMGGMAITQAAARCPEQVVALVYVVGVHYPADGQSLLDLTAYPEAADDQVQANLVVEGDPPVATMPAAAARDALYDCCDEEQAAWALQRLGPQPVAPFTAAASRSATRPEAFAAPATRLRHLHCRTARSRRRCSGGCSTAAGCDPVIELDTDHAPWLSRTDELVAALGSRSPDAA